MKLMQAAVHQARTPPPWNYMKAYSLELGGSLAVACKTPATEELFYTSQPEAGSISRLNGTVRE
jgi:hypothetical protein